MSTRRKPTQRDLLIVVGRLEHALQRVLAAYQNDRDPNRWDTIHGIATPAITLAGEARDHFPAIDRPSGPWSKEQA